MPTCPSQHRADYSDNDRRGKSDLDTRHKCNQRAKEQLNKGANFGKDELLYHRLSFMDKQLWVTHYNPDEKYAEGKYPNRSDKDSGLGQFTHDNQSIENTDDVVWLTTGTTHTARAEEWPIMPTEWVHVLLKPWNFFDETPTLNLNVPK
jgi:primary-amine oxidase